MNPLTSNTLCRWAVLLAAVTVLAGCAREAWHAPLALPAADSALVQAFPNAGKVKVRGNVYIQAGHGNAVTDNTNAGRKGSAATAPGAVASTTRPAGVPAWVYGLLVVLGVAGGFWLRGRLKIPLPF